MHSGSHKVHRNPSRGARQRMKRVFSLLPALFSSLLTSCAAPLVDTLRDPAAFSVRCSDSQIIRCFGFEKEELSANGGPIVWSSFDAPVGTFLNGSDIGADLSGRVELATDQKASGESSLKFHMPSQTGSGFAGQFYANFSDDYSIQFGEGDEFYVQWRQRFSKAFVENNYRPDTNWKQAIVGEGDRADSRAWSCTQIELVVNRDDFGYPAMYHSCGGKDGKYDPIDQNWPIRYEPDQWMTFQIRIKIGTWYLNDSIYRNDSMIELWVALEGERSRIAVRQRYDLANNNENARYGKIWLLPFLTGKIHLRFTRMHTLGMTS